MGHFDYSKTAPHLLRIESSAFALFLQKRPSESFGDPGGIRDGGSLRPRASHRD